VAIIGGGQAALAVGYYLRRRTGLSFVILDSEDGPGDAWRHGWDSLLGFSPARYSSLPGRLMPGGEDKYPTRDEVVDYLADYERRYELPVRRPVRVEGVYREEGRLAVGLDRVRLPVRAVVSATGTWRRSHVPDYPGRETFRGEQTHSAHYVRPEEESIDAVMWCTGFRPSLGHLEPLGVIGNDGRVDTYGTRSVLERRLWLVGYGDWTGYASATLVGVGRTARSTVEEIEGELADGVPVEASEASKA
jgi:hypothetical protein